MRITVIDKSTGKEVDYNELDKEAGFDIIFIDLDCECFAGHDFDSHPIDHTKYEIRISG